MLTVVVKGFFASLGLIVAIGAQNAFVLKQGLKQEYIFWICLICAFSDSLLILAGVFGFGQIISMHSGWVQIAQYFGAAFLFIYGAQHFYDALVKQKKINLAGNNPANFTKIILICLAFTWLNPHVYLDTVILIGAISTQFSGYKLYFAIGAILASWLFFFSLGYAAKFLRPFFQNPKSWKVLDLCIGVIMWMIAFSLLAT